MFWKKKKEKTIEEREEMIAEMTYETARGSFDYPHGYTLTLEDLDELQARYAHWKDNSSGEGEHNWQFMQRAYHLLSTPLIKVAWDQFPPSSITLREALKVFGNEPYDEPSNEDVPKQHDLNHRFGSFSRHGLSTIEDAERLDAAYHLLYEHSKPSGYMNPEPIEPPCLLRFKNVIAKEKAAGWESPKVGKWEITDKEAHAVFGIEDVGKFLPPDVTEMFKERQVRCTSVEDAEKLDLAYRWLFTLSCKFEKDFTVQIASPYAPVLAKKLGLPLPVAEIKPVIAEAPQDQMEDVIEAPSLSDVEEDSVVLTKAGAKHFLKHGLEHDDFLPSEESGPLSLSLLHTAYGWTTFDITGDRDDRSYKTTVIVTKVSRLDNTELSKSEVQERYSLQDVSTLPEGILENFHGWITIADEPQEDFDCYYVRSAVLKIVETKDVYKFEVKAVIAEATQEEEPALSEVAEPEEAAPVPVSDLSVEEALRVFVLERNDEFDEEELTARYEDKSAITDSKAAQVKIDTAYEVLKAHLEKEVAYQQERMLFGYGPTETFTRKDLDYRYNQASQRTDSKTKQKILDEAYQVLLKIAA